jgi:NAD(P)H dehydrogenase (quinone)
MATLITAASGHLGRLAIDALLARGTDPADIVATARDVSKIADLSGRGIRVAPLDYARPETIAPALHDVESVLLISASAGDRITLHRDTVNAIAEVGVEKLVYTSAPRATTSTLLLAPDHKATEEAIAASGLPAVILRNNWYTENYALDLARAAETGVLVASVGAGHVASASRADFAEAAAAVLREDGHLGAIYELAGDVSWDYHDLAAAMADVVGREVVYQSLTEAEHRAALEAAGLDAHTIAFITSIDSGIRDGMLGETDGTLSRLIGRPTTPLVEGLRGVFQG